MNSKLKDVHRAFLSLWIKSENFPDRAPAKVEYAAFDCFLVHTFFLEVSRHLPASRFIAQMGTCMTGSSRESKIGERNTSLLELSKAILDASDL